MNSSRSQLISTLPTPNTTCRTCPQASLLVQCRQVPGPTTETLDGPEEAVRPVSGGRTHESERDVRGRRRAVSRVLCAIAETDAGVSLHSNRTLQRVCRIGEDGQLSRPVLSRPVLHEGGMAMGLSGLFKGSSIETLKERKDVGGLTKRLLGKKEDNRVEAAFALAEMGGPKGVDALVTACGHPDPSVRMAGAMSLGTMKDPSASSRLKEVYDDTSLDPNVRRLAIEGLSSIRDPDLLPYWVAKLQEGNHDEASTAASAIGWLGNKGGGDVLLRAIAEKNDPEVRYICLVSLARLQDTRVLEQLRDHLREISNDLPSDFPLGDWFYLVDSLRDFGDSEAAAILSDIKGLVGDAKLREHIDTRLAEFRQDTVRETPTVVEYESVATDKTQRAVELCQEYMDRDHPIDATMQLLGVKRTKPNYTVVQNKVVRGSYPHIDMMIVSVASCLPSEDVDINDTTKSARLALEAIQHYASVPKVRAFFLLPYHLRTRTVVEGSAVPPEEECAVYAGVENLLLEIYRELPDGGTITDETVEQKIDQLIKSAD